MVYWSTVAPTAWHKTLYNAYVLQSLAFLFRVPHRLRYASAFLVHMKKCTEKEKIEDRYDKQDDINFASNTAIHDRHKTLL